MRTASRRNSSVYLVAILNLLHSKHCSKETGTKPWQDQSEKEPEGFSEFGYFGWHGIIRVPEEVKSEVFFEDFPKFFELQIKTIFQHAWAEAEHDLVYNQFSGSLKRDEKRLIAYAAAQAWGADNSFAVVMEQLELREEKKG